MGHIELAAPVAHIWFLRSLPSRIGNLIDLSLRDLEKVLYFESYVVLDPMDTEMEFMSLLTEQEYRERMLEFGTEGFRAGIGAEAVRELLQNIDLEALAKELRKDLRETGSEAKRKKYIKRLKVVYSLLDSINKPCLLYTSPSPRD